MPTVNWLSPEEIVIPRLNRTPTIPDISVEQGSAAEVIVGWHGPAGETHTTHRLPSGGLYGTLPPQQKQKKYGRTC